VVILDNLIEGWAILDTGICACLMVLLDLGG
jgi:hypothetical protein